MRHHRSPSWWISPTTAITTSTTTTLIAAVVALLTTMVLSVQSVSDLLDENVPVPEFLPGATNVTVREGDAALLPCSVRHLGTKQVVWRRIRGDEDKFLTIGTMTWSDDNNISMDHSRKRGHVSNWNLIIQHVKPEDAGLYECQVTSKAGHVRLVKLMVVGPPITKPVISITGKKYVDLGEKIHLVCNASGGRRIPDEIDWFKEGDKIDSVKYRHVMIEKYQSMADRSFISELIIDHSSLLDTGDYICRSSRNDIANLKVTVLHAGSDNKRRGTLQSREEYESKAPVQRDSSTGQSPVMGKNQDYNNGSPNHAPRHMTSLATALVFSLLTLYSAPFGLYS